MMKMKQSLVTNQMDCDTIRSLDVGRDEDFYHIPLCVSFPNLSFEIRCALTYRTITEGK